MDDLQNLVTGSESSLAKLNDNDDVQRALSLASSMAAALNYRSKDATMNGTTSASYDKDISKQVTRMFKNVNCFFFLKGI